MKRLGSVSGFTLMEIMVAMGLVAIVESVMMCLFEAQKKAMAQVEERMEQMDVLHEIKGLLQNAPICTETFQSKNAISMPEDEVKMIRVPDGEHVRLMYSTDSAFGKQVGILGYRLESKELADSESGDLAGFYAGREEGFANLVVRFARKNVVPISKKIRLRVQTVSATDRRVTYCQALGGGG